MNFGDKKETKNKFNAFEHLSQELSGDLLKLLKQKGVYSYIYMDNFKKIL